MSLLKSIKPSLGDKNVLGSRANVTLDTLLQTLVSTSLGDDTPLETRIWNVVYHYSTSETTVNQINEAGRLLHKYCLQHDIRITVKQIKEKMGEMAGDLDDVLENLDTQRLNSLSRILQDCNEIHNSVEEIGTSII